jgi:hypothetical protein
MGEIVLQEMSSGSKPRKVNRKVFKFPSVHETLFGYDRHRGGNNAEQYPYIPIGRTLKRKILNTEKLALRWANAPTKKVF